MIYKYKIKPIAGSKNFQQFVGDLYAVVRELDAKVEALAEHLGVKLVWKSPKDGEFVVRPQDQSDGEAPVKKGKK